MVKNNRVWLFFAVACFFWFSLYAYVPYVGPYAEEMYADFRMIGLITGSYGFTQMVIRFPLGIFSDKIGKRKVFIMGGLFFAAISGIIVYLSPSPNMLLAARSLGGVAASSWVIFMILGTAYSGRENTVKMVGTLNASNALGRMGALLTGGFIAQFFGFSYAFLLGGLVGVLGLVLSFILVEKKPEIESPPKISELISVAKNKQLLAASILSIIVQYISFSTTFGFIPIAAAALGASNYQLGLLGVAATLPGLLVAPAMARVLKKIGVLKALCIAFLLSSLASFLTPLASEIWHLFALQVINNIGMVASFTLLMALCIQDIKNERRAAAMGFFQAVYGLGMFLGPFIMGYVAYNFGLGAAFIFTGLVGILGIILSFFFSYRKFLVYK